MSLHMKETEQYKISYSLQKKQTGIVGKVNVTNQKEGCLLSIGHLSLMLGPTL